MTSAFPLRSRLFAICLLAALVGGCSKEKAETKEIHLSRANAYVEAGQWDKAEQEYRDTLRVASNDPAALRGLGILAFDQGQLQKAFPLLKQAAESNPDDIEVQIRLSLTYLTARDYGPARDAALTILEKQPAHERALLLLVDTATSPDDLAQTRKLVEGYRAKDQDRPGYHLAFGALDLRQNDAANAETEFKRALELDPKSVASYSALGNLYWARHDISAADEAYKKAADLSPVRSAARMRYVDFKLQSGATADATKIVEEMARQAPDFLPTRVYLMKVACAERRTDDCAARVQNILTQDSVNYDALFQSGVLTLQKGEAAQAIRIFNQLANVYGKDAKARYQLALAYLLYAKSALPAESRNASQAAEANLSLAVQLDPNFAPAVMLFAELKIRKGVAPAAEDLLVPLVKNNPQIAQAQYLLASSYIAQRKNDQALAVYGRMAELFPKDALLPFETGKLQMALRQTAEARESFEKSVSLSPDFLPAVEALIDTDLIAKQYGSALDRVQRLIDKDPKNAVAWAIRGKVYQVQQDIQHAEQDLLKAIDLNPKLEPAYLMLSQLYVATNRPERAIEKLNEFVGTNKTVPALLQLAGIYDRQKQFEKARDAYEEALKIAPDIAPVLNNLAVLYSEHLGQADKALEFATKAKELTPNEPHAADTLGWVLFKRANYRNALTQLQEAAAKMPDEPEVQFHLGMTYYMLGDEGAARDALQKAANSTKEFAQKAEALRRLDFLSTQVGSSGSDAKLEDYVRDNPNDPFALTRLAQIQAKTGALAQAVQNLEKVVTNDPLFAPATRELTLLYAKQPTDVSKAYDLASRARQAYPDDPEIAKTLGILNYRRDAYPQAVGLLKEAAAKRQDDPEVFFYLGSGYYQLKQWDECKTTLQRALSLNVAAAFTDQANRELAECSESAP